MSLPLSFCLQDFSHPFSFSFRPTTFVSVVSALSSVTRGATDCQRPFGRKPDNANTQRETIQSMTVLQLQLFETDF